MHLPFDDDMTAPTLPDPQWPLVPAEVSGFEETT
jgi:hypothetical protein